MLRASDIRKLSEFRSNATAHLDRLARTGAIEVLTVNGEAKGVVMSPRVFDAIADQLDLMDATASVKRGLADVAAGRTRNAKKAIRSLASELGLDLKARGK